MGRLQGPKHRMCRRVGERLCTGEKCPVGRRQQPPGVHGPKGYKRLTEYGTQLREKQKAKYLYRVMERQFRHYYDKAAMKEGNTSDHFLRSLELRLDNIVFRLGFARTRAQSRQMVSHGWVQVNGKRVSIASYQVKVGDTITLKPKALDSALIKNIATQKRPADTSRWLSVDDKKFEGKILSLPEAEDFPPNLNMTLVVEYYSR